MAAVAQGLRFGELTAEELLRAVDRSDPEVAALAARLEEELRMRALLTEALHETQRQLGRLADTLIPRLRHARSES